MQREPFHLGINTLFLIPSQVGGSETYLLETLRELLPLLRGRCTFFTNRDNDALLRREVATLDLSARVDFSLLDFSAVNRFSRIIREQTQLVWRLRRLRCDVLWSPGYTAPLFAPCRQAVSILDMQYRRFPQDLSPIAWLTTHALVGLGARFCKRIIAISEFSKREILALTCAREERIDVAYGAVSATFFSVAASSGEGVNTPYIFCVAGSYPHKNLPQLVRAFDAIASRVPHRLKLVGGKGRGEAELSRAILSAAAHDRIDRLMGLSREALTELYANASLFVLPSRYEGFGLPVLEAQAAGVPVLTTRCGSLKEVAGSAAVFYDSQSDEDLENKILQLLTMTEARRAELVASGRANAKRFTWRKTALVTLESLYRTMN